MSASPSGPARRPRVLQIVTSLEAGGAPLAVLQLTRVLNGLGYDARMLTGTCDPDLDMSYLLTEHDSVQRVPEMSRSLSLTSDLAAVWHLYRIMRATKPAIVQTHSAKAGALGRVAAWLARVPVVIHTFHGHVMCEYFPPHISLAIRLVERTLARLCDIICVLAPQQQHDLVQRFRIAPLRKLRVVPLGLDLEPFRKLAPTARTDGWLTVGWLGRMVEVKNLPLLIQVIEETFRRSDRIRFIVAGDGTERPFIEEATRRWGPDRLEWLGWTPDVQGVVARCDVLIQTSRNEGTPIALIQGMAAGRPFVSTPAGGVVDMVTGTGKAEPAGGQWFSNAVLVGPDADAFASVLCQLHQDNGRLRTMGAEAAAFAVGHYSLEVLARNYAQLYGALLSEECGLKSGETISPTQSQLRPSLCGQPIRQIGGTLASGRDVNH